MIEHTMEEPSRLSSGGSSISEAADTGKAYRETNWHAHLGFGHEFIGLPAPLGVPQIFRCRGVLKSIIKKGRRLQCGEGRAGGNLELEGL
jgi:hypothetical protein